MEHIRFSIETSYEEDENSSYTFVENYIFENPVHDNTVSTSNSQRAFMSVMDVFFLLISMASSRVLERSMLQETLRISEEEKELHRDESKKIKICGSEYKPDEGDEEKSCTICSDSLKEGDVTSILPCGHIFHHDCIKEWCHYKAVCPLCKKNIPLTKENLTSDKDNVEEVKTTME